MYLPVRLQTSFPRALHVLLESAQAAAGVCGIFLTQLTPWRVAVSVTVLFFATLSLGRAADETPAFVSMTFGFALAARHAFAFASFGDKGIAPLLKARLGSELGFSIYESVMALLIFAQRLSFVRLILATAHTPTGALGTALVSSGAAFILLGVGVSVWATRIIGLDNYHYRDLYSGPSHVNLELRGPYAIFANPLYGVGQLAAHGAALMLLSPIGVLAATLHQLMLYAFNARVEQPHLRAAARISVDTALLSRSLFDATPLVDARPVAPAVPPRRSRARDGLGAR
jgi:protein-S-isoprenylcysteine O-methyltransferase Ste14